MNVRTAYSKLTSPRKVIGFVCAGLTCLTAARVVILLVESYTAVRSERLADAELIQMCNQGTASMSTDFRALCMRKRAEQAAPVLLKALMRACTTAFTDFCETLSSPLRVVLLLLFCVTGVAAPVVKAGATLFVDQLKRHRRRRGRIGYSSDDDDSGDDDAESKCPMIVVSPNCTDEYGTTMRNRMALGLRRSVRQLQRRARGSAAGLSTPAMLLGRLEEDESED